MKKRHSIIFHNTYSIYDKLKNTKNPLTSVGPIHILRDVLESIYNSKRGSAQQLISGNAIINNKEKTFFKLIELPLNSFKLIYLEIETQIKQVILINLFNENEMISDYKDLFLIGTSSNTYRIISTEGKSKTVLNTYRAFNRYQDFYDIYFNKRVTLDDFVNDFKQSTYSPNFDNRFHFIQFEEVILIIDFSNKVPFEY